MKRKSSVPKMDPSSKFVVVERRNATKIFKLKLDDTTPRVLIEPSHWQLKNQPNGKNGFYLEISVEEFTNDYLDWMYYKILKNELDMKLVFELFPNTKEWTESAAMEFHARPYMSPNTQIIVVADGTSPRTAYLFGALHSAHSIYSVDPLMKTNWIKHPILQNLKITPVAELIEDFLMHHEAKVEQVLIIAPHSHAPLSQIVSKFKTTQKLVIIAMPCCFEQVLTKEEQSNHGLKLCMDEYDFNVHSEKNKIQIWA